MSKKAVKQQQRTPLPTCANCGQQIRPDRTRTDYEVDVLRTVFPEAKTKAEVVRAAISFAYERVLAERSIPLRKPA